MIFCRTFGKSHNLFELQFLILKIMYLSQMITKFPENNDAVIQNIYLMSHIIINYYLVYSALKYVGA